MTYEVAALVTVPNSLDYGYYGSDEFVLNSETFCRDTGTDCVMSYAFNTTDEATPPWSLPPKLHGAGQSPAGLREPGHLRRGV